MSLTPAFVLWALIATTLILVTGGILWLVEPRRLGGLLRRLWLADLVALWLAYAAGYHLLFLDTLRPVLGPPWALWALCGVLGAYALLRRLPTPLRRPSRLFALLVLAWALVAGAGHRYVQETAADAALLAQAKPEAFRRDAALQRPLWRALLLTRLEPEARVATATVLRALHAGAPPPERVAAFRHAVVPRLLHHFERDLVKLRTYAWVQTALLGVALLVWGFGHVPPGDPPGRDAGGSAGGSAGGARKARPQR